MSFVTCPSCGYKTHRSGEETVVPRPEVRGTTSTEVIKVTSKTPWFATAAAVIMAAAIGAWALWPTGTPVTPSYATVSAIAGPGTVFTGGVPSASGIENVYIIATSGLDDDNENVSGDPDILGVIEADSGSTNIPYETAFTIVVAVKAHSDNLAYVVRENMKVELTGSGSFTISAENAGDSANSHLAAEPFDNSGYGTTSGWLRINAVWDNGGTGYRLPAGGTLSLDPIRLWGWD